MVCRKARERGDGKKWTRSEHEVEGLRILWDYGLILVQWGSTSWERRVRKKATRR